MKISASYYSAIGGRDENEDSVSILESGDTVLGIVADGLGGHEKGEVASKMAIKKVNSLIGQEQVTTVLLKNAIQEANKEIWELSNGQGMKTTIAALWFNSKNALAATVGDTRIYQFRNGKIIFQSKDHSVTQLAVIAGDLDEKDIRGNKDRNRLIRALGANEDVKIDICQLEVANGDAFLVCSDGFWDKIWEDKMLQDLENAGTGGEWLCRMKDRVQQHQTDTSDNHSAIAVLIGKEAD